MEEENREQPTIEPANVINITNEDGAVSEVGSQGNLGKFKSADKLLEAYNNLQSEFTKKCQLLSQLQRDKMEQNSTENSADMVEQTTNNENFNETTPSENLQNKDLALFLDANADAKNFEEEIKQKVDSSSQDPYQVAWARVVLDHITSSKQKESDPIVNKYILSDSQVRNQIIQDYLNDLAKQQTPYVISSQGGERVSSVAFDTPSSLAEAKEIINKMFS